MTPERLRAIVTDALDWNGTIMKSWDNIRGLLLKREHSVSESDLPRLIFESNILEPLTDALTEAANEIERLQKARSDLKTG